MKKGWRTNLTVNWRFREKPRKREKRKNPDELWKEEKRSERDSSRTVVMG
jgi:hypothetical protein